MIYAQPNGPEADITPMPATPSWAEQIWAATLHQLNQIPGWAWAGALATLGLLTLVMLPIARAQARKAGARINGKTSPADRKDRRLLAAVLTPAILFWLAVLVGSGRSLIQFGRDDLGWTGGWELLVPFTLDGVAVAFGALAFRAIAKERNPDRAYRVVWMATAASAAINFFHEVGGSTLGAGYLAILSLFGMLIFHELLAQFEEGAAWIKRTNPKFGLRWITWPTNTLCAWVAWRNYPPAEGTNASIGLAVEHLETVRRAKTERNAAKVDNPVWWMRFAPWSNVQALRTALDAERVNAACSVEELTSELAGRLDRQAATLRSELESERQKHTLAVSELEQRIADRDTETERMAERFRQAEELRRSEEAERINGLLAEHKAERDADREKLRSGHEAELAQLRAELAKNIVPIRRPNSGNTNRSSKPAPARSTDTEALADLFAEHPESGYDWTDREVNRITGAGFSSRAPRLTGMAIKHLAECPERTHETCYTERSASGSDDSKENAS